MTQPLGWSNIRFGISAPASAGPTPTGPMQPNWFDRQMQALEPFQVALTLCFTPAHLGLEEHHTSPPRDNADFAAFASWAVARYAPASTHQTDQQRTFP